MVHAFKVELKRAGEWTSTNVVVPNAFHSESQANAVAFNLVHGSPNYGLEYRVVAFLGEPSADMAKGAR